VHFFSNSANVCVALCKHSALPSGGGSPAGVGHRHRGFALLFLQLIYAYWSLGKFSAKPPVRRGLKRSSSRM
jgi:hypothetical protein